LGGALTVEELADIDRVSEGLDGELGRNLTVLLSAEEIASIHSYGLCRLCHVDGMDPSVLPFADKSAPARAIGNG
jgi:hypothetical protein